MKNITGKPSVPKGADVLQPFPHTSAMMRKEATAALQRGDEATALDLTAAAKTLSERSELAVWVKGGAA